MEIFFGVTSLGSSSNLLTVDANLRTSQKGIKLNKSFQVHSKFIKGLNLCTQSVKCNIAVGLKGSSINNVTQFWTIFETTL